jgi:hypothetical protein
MPTYSILAVLCLAALWTTALLVAASALGELRALRALRASLRPPGREFVRDRSRLVLLFVVTELLACAICTRLATWPPAFGSVGTLGGALCLAFFLAVTPAGVWVRDRCRVPALLHGTWVKRTPSRGRAADRAEAPS